MTTDLLPPASTTLERAFSHASTRVGEVPVPLAALWDPATCPEPILPWLAWALSVDSWDPEWTGATKRAAVANSIAEHRIKGTRASVEAVLERFDALLEIVEWHETAPRGPAHTFEVFLPLVLEDGTAPGGRRSTAAFAEQLIREIARTKPLREHFTLVQQLTAAAGIGIQGAMRVAGLLRAPMEITIDESQPWESLLQDENGEPLQDDAGAFLDETP
ncbi:phage tail protein I [Sphingomonas koreensis]|uniref:phage tail protein I n=1 Tax=Sphingomonas koreensis TaxID=93064 RepID=UPI000F7D9D75|nr:phage tail protein I [Sphingomonas koreensis]MDC7808789.1 phage tail protein I [Sphingomonas koreensis]RSU98929.1 phage tail protein I [Sphingomonas koreensis]